MCGVKWGNVVWFFSTGDGGRAGMCKGLLVFYRGVTCRWVLLGSGGVVFGYMIKVYIFIRE